MKTITIDGVEYDLVPKETTSVPRAIYVTLSFQVGDRFEFNLVSSTDNYIINKLFCNIEDYTKKEVWDNYEFIQDLYYEDFSKIPEVQGQDLEDLKAVLKMSKPYWDGKPLINKLL